MFSDNSISHTLARSLNFKKFHIIAALPINESSLQHACQSFQGDVITYNSSTIKMRINRKFYYLALRRNIFFELKYSSAIEDSNGRQATIARAQHFHMSGKLKGILISSGATSRYLIRSPSNISCLGLLFGLNEEKAKFAISTASLKVLIAAESRRLGRVPVLMQYGDVNTSTSEISSDSDSESTENSKKRKTAEFIEKATGENKKFKSC